MIVAWVDPARRDAHHSQAFRKYVEQQTVPVLVRYSSSEGFVIFPPSMTGRQEGIVEHESSRAARGGRAGASHIATARSLLGIPTPTSGRARLRVRSSTRRRPGDDPEQQDLEAVRRARARRSLRASTEVGRVRRARSPHGPTRVQSNEAGDNHLRESAVQIVAVPARRAERRVGQRASTTSCRAMTARSPLSFEQEADRRVRCHPAGRQAVRRLARLSRRAWVARAASRRLLHAVDPAVWTYKSPVSLFQLGRGSSSAQQRALARPGARARRTIDRLVRKRARAD